MVEKKAPVILFADANLAWGRPVRVEFRRRGATVTTAVSVDDAIQRAAEATPDMLVLDDGLPGHEGRDFPGLFRARLPDTEIVLLESGGSPTPLGIGLGLLHAGPRESAERRIIEAAEVVLGDRLAPASALRPRRVLCVDDEEAYLKAISRMLSRRGYDVHAFSVAELALEDVPRAMPDVALVDIMMPGMGGLELARRIRGEGDVPIVFLTGLDTDEVHYEAHQTGASYFVAKTEGPERVLDVVDFFAGDLDESERQLLKERV